MQYAVGIDVGTAFTKAVVVAETSCGPEVLGRGIAQGISREYYPSKDRTLGALAVKYGYAIGRDALTNTFREFWPDIATHVLHRHP